VVAEIADDPVQRVCTHVVRGIAGGSDQVDDPRAGALSNLVKFLLENQILLP
jgi:hypothetical protein